MQTFWQDLRYGFRVLAKKPGFTFIAVLTLALGIGACTALFSIVDAVLLRSLPYPAPQRILELREINARGRQVQVTEPNFNDLRAQNHELAAVAAYAGGLMTVTGGNQPVRTKAYVVTEDFFKTLGVQPLLGRAFTADETKRSDNVGVIVSYGFWQRLLGGRTDFSGMNLQVSNQSFAVIGVMPPEFKYPDGAEVWLPYGFYPPNTSRTAHNWRAVARLRDGATIEQARADVDAIGKQLKATYGKAIDAESFALTPIQEYQAREVRQGLLVLLGAVGFLLLIACANVANLLLAQATSRQKELAVRTALGATRGRLARQFIAESLLLALMAGTAGALLSVWGVDLLVALNHDNLPRADDIHVDVRALIFTLGLAVLVAVVLGLVPVLRNTDKDLHAALNQSSRGQSANAISRYLRSLLVVSQVALTLVLLIGAGLLARSFLQLLKVDPGFRPENTVAMDVSLPFPETEAAEQRLSQFYRQLFERLNQVPGVSAVGGVDGLPMTSMLSNGTFLIDNDKLRPGEAEFRVASGSYFATLGIPLMQGRVFDERDTPTAPHAAIISQSLAQRYFADTDPIGQRIQFGNMDGYLQLLNVVGVVGDVRDNGLEGRVAATVYVNYVQRPRRSADFSIVVRGQTSAASLIAAMRGEVQALNRDVPMDFRTVAQIFSSSLDNRRFSLVLFGFFAVAGLLLAVTGIYGVMAYSVAERTREIGIRRALGAQAGDVLKLIIGHGMKLMLIGVGIGLIGAFALTRLIASWLFGIGATDPVTFIAVVVLLAGVALLACYIPARRATKVDPMVALRYE